MPPRLPMTPQNSSTGAQRLALAAREAFEDDALFVGQFLADDRDQEHAPGAPAIGRQKAREVERAFERLAHRYELAQAHGRPSRARGRLKCSTSGLIGSRTARFDPEPRQNPRRRVRQAGQLLDVDKLATQDGRLKLFALDDHRRGLAHKSALRFRQGRRAAEVVGERHAKSRYRLASAVRPSTFASKSFPLVIRLRTVRGRSAMARVADNASLKLNETIPGRYPRIMRSRVYSAQDRQMSHYETFSRARASDDVSGDRLRRAPLTTPPVEEGTGRGKKTGLAHSMARPFTAGRVIPAYDA